LEIVMRRFFLDRIEDQSGVSGTGCVAQGIIFTDGTAVLRWLTQFKSTALYATMDELVAIHCHGGKSKIRWLDKVCFQCGCTADNNYGPGHCLQCGASWDSPVDGKDPSLGSWRRAVVIPGTDSTP
jgi:hypothetical protein